MKAVSIYAMEGLTPPPSPSYMDQSKINKFTPPHQQQQLGSPPPAYLKKNIYQTKSEYKMNMFNRTKNGQHSLFV